MHSELIIPPPSSALLGCESSSVDDSGGSMIFIPTDKMVNPFGMVQGGLLTAMLDDVMGMTAFHFHPRPFTTIQLASYFLNGARPGDRLLARGRVLRPGKRQLFMEAELHRLDDDGEPEKLLVTATCVELFLDTHTAT